MNETDKKIDNLMVYGEDSQYLFGINIKEWKAGNPVPKYIIEPKCECGSLSVGSSKHSSWCPLHHLEA